MIVTFELRSKILEGVKQGFTIKAFLVFSMASFHLSIVSGGVWLDAFMVDLEQL